LPGKAKYWIRACRPETLSISIAPVLAGTGLAWAQTAMLDWTIFLLVFIAAALIQMGTNLHNDSANSEPGGDAHETRLGPARATEQGWLTVAQVRTGALSCFCLAGAAGIYLVVQGGWPILLAGLASIAAGWSYSGGPRPIAYTPLGELFVLIFFGIVAVVGSYYLQVGSFSYTALLTGLIIGMPAAAVLAVDNYRDLHSDCRVGRRTFVIRFGLRAARIEYTLLMILPFTLLPLVTSSVAPKLTTALPFVALPWVFFLVYRFWKELPGPVFNGYMVATARVQLFLAGLLVVSWGLGAT